MHIWKILIFAANILAAPLPTLYVNLTGSERWILKMQRIFSKRLKLSEQKCRAKRTFTAPTSLWISNVYKSSISISWLYLLLEEDLGWILPCGKRHINATLLSRLRSNEVAYSSSFNLINGYQKDVPIVSSTLLTVIEYSYQGECHRIFFVVLKHRTKAALKTHVPS